MKVSIPRFPALAVAALTLAAVSLCAPAAAKNGDPAGGPPRAWK